MTLGRHHSKRRPFHIVNQTKLPSLFINPDTGKIDTSIQKGRITVFTLFNLFRLTLTKLQVILMIKFPQIEE